jgi:WD40 repeat protein
LALGYPSYSRRGPSIDLIRLTDFQRVQDVEVPDSIPFANSIVALSPDGSRLATLNTLTGRLWLAQRRGDRLEAWHLWDEEASKVLPGLDQALAFHPTEDKLVASGSAFAIAVWNLAKKSEVRWLRGHRAAVASLAFSPDGNRLVSGGCDHTVRIWDWRLGEELLALRNKNYGALCARFSPDGLQLANTDSDPPAWLRTAVPWWQDESDHERNRTAADDPVLDMAGRLRLTGITLQQAQLLLEAGSRDKAIEQCQAVFDLRRSLLGDNHPATLGAREQLRLARTPGKTNSLPPQSN